MLIPDAFIMSHGEMKKWIPLRDGLAAYQLVGGVMATKATTGSWSERMSSHTGTETRPRLLREAAVRNLAQWAKA